MKKRFFLLLFLIVTFSFTSLSNIHAQNSDVELKGTDNMNSKVVGYILNEKTNEYLKDAVLYSNPGGKLELQVKFVNNFSQDIPMFVEFPDGTFTSNTNARACKVQNKSTIFSKIINGGEILNVIIPANSELIKKIDISVPINYNGLIRGCMVYGVNNIDYDQNINGFSIQYVKEQYIDLFVAGDAEIKSSLSFQKLDKSTKTKDLSSNPSIKAYFDENDDFAIDVKIINDGSLDEIANISGTISNMFGYKDTFERKDVKVVTTSQGVALTTKGQKRFKLPSYKGPYTIELKVDYKPTFDFDISNSNIDPKILEGGTFTEKASIFLMPWMALVILVVFAILVKMAFRKRTTDDCATDSHKKK